MDKGQKQLVATIIVVACIFGGTFGAFLGMQAAWNTPIPVVVVTSGSMEPTIYRGDVLFIQGARPDAIEAGDHETRTGDVIVYETAGVWLFPIGEPVVHRVVNKILMNGTWYFRTHGDNNIMPDPYLVPEHKVYGKVIGTFPWIGHVKLFLDESGIGVPLLVILLVLLATSIAWDVVKARKEQATNSPAVEEPPRGQPQEGE